MIKFQLAVVVVVGTVALTQAAYYSRAGTLTRVRSATPPPAAAPRVFRPGAALQQRPFHRLVPAASHRAPYFLYKTPPHRYAVKHLGPTTGRSVFPSGPWKSSATAPRLPGLGLSPAPEYDFVRAASAPPPPHDAGGRGIHTIPAPNLSLSEKPIVVIESGPRPGTDTAAGQLKPSYEVTERYLEPAYQIAKIETPVGFSKIQYIQSSPELPASSHLRRGAGAGAGERAGAAPHSAPGYGLAAISVPLPRTPGLPRGPALPHTQQFFVQGFQGFSGVPTQRDLPSTGAESVTIPPNVVYQSDPLFLQKLQQQLLQRFPEFVPYAAELMPQNTQHEAPQAQRLFLLENEDIKQPPQPFLASESKNIVQRETQESSLVTPPPRAFVVHNVTDKIEPTTTAELPHNITLELIAADSQPVTATIEYVMESNTEPQTARITEPENAQNTTPIYYAQVSRSFGNVMANRFYSAMNDVREAAAMKQVLENIPQTTKAPQNVTTLSPIGADLKQYFVQNEISENESATELKPLLGVPFAKPADSVKVAYTLLRTEETEPRTTREGAVYAGQIVEASISEDHDFNNQKATVMKRAPIRLYIADKEATSQALVASSTPEVKLVKAKIPPESKLTFDDNTGEHVLRIYANYVDSPIQRQVVTSKLATLASLKPAPAGTAGGWKATTVTSADKTQGFEGNQVAKFGLKLRSRSDDYIPLFEEYDE